MGFAPFTARVEPGSSATTIALAGELDMETVPILEEHLVHAEADGVAAIVIDLVELTFIESVGLRAFLAARERESLLRALDSVSRRVGGVMGTKGKGGTKIRRKPPQKTIKEKRKSRKIKRAASGR